MGMLETGGDVMTMVIPDRKSGTLMPIIRANVKQGATIHTDEWLGYGGVGMMGYRTAPVNHSKDQYVCRTTGATVNAIEGFWAS